ncbi:MAG TPA: hypothetical protein VGJ21_20980, partial [Terracidiphilus sp.]
SAGFDKSLPAHSDTPISRCLPKNEWAFFYFHRPGMSYKHILINNITKNNAVLQITFPQDKIQPGPNAVFRSQARLITDQ